MGIVERRAERSNRLRHACAVRGLDFYELRVRLEACVAQRPRPRCQRLSRIGTARDDPACLMTQLIKEALNSR